MTTEARYTIRHTLLGSIGPLSLHELRSLLIFSQLVLLDAEHGSVNHAWRFHPWIINAEVTPGC